MGMFDSKKKLKKGIRSATGQKDPYERPEEDYDAKQDRSRAERMYAAAEKNKKKDPSVEEQNKARRKWLEERSSKRKKKMTY